MARADLTEIACVMDRSGSMASIAKDAVGGFNAFLEEQKKGPGEATFTLTLFNTEYEIVHDGVPIAEAVPLDDTSYKPGGCTALLDAIGRTIETVGQRLRDTAEEKRPANVIVVILTDGLENSSTYFTRKRIFQMIQHQQDAYQWQFIFLAANQDAIQSGGSLAIGAAQTQNYQPTGAGVRGATRSMSSAVSQTRSTGSTKGWKAP